MGDEYRTSLGYGGRGNDTINLPGSFGMNFSSTVTVNGGEGDDHFKAKEAGTGGDNVNIYGDEGNDKIEGIHNVTNSSLIQGGDGDDKVIAGSGLTAEQHIEGNEGDDIIYGADDGIDELLLGDFSSTIITANELDMPALGGNDKIYGSNNLTGT